MELHPQAGLHTHYHAHRQKKAQTKAAQPALGVALSPGFPPAYAAQRGNLNWPGDCLTVQKGHPTTLIEKVKNSLCRYQAEL